MQRWRIATAHPLPKPARERPTAAPVTGLRTETSREGSSQQFLKELASSLALKVNCIKLHGHNLAAADFQPLWLQTILPAQTEQNKGVEGM